MVWLYPDRTKPKVTPSPTAIDLEFLFSEVMAPESQPEHKLKRNGYVMSKEFTGSETDERYPRHVHLSLGGIV